MPPSSDHTHAEHRRIRPGDRRGRGGRLGERASRGLRWAGAFLVWGVALGGLHACGDGTAPPSVESIELGEQTVVAPVGSAAPVTVQALDAAGAPVAGAAVELRPSAGSVSPARGETGPDGRFRAEWTLGTQSGEQRLVIESGGASRTVVATAEALVPVSLSVATGGSQAGEVGEPLPESVVLVSEDEFGNPSGGAEVELRVVAGGGSIDPASGITGADGTLAATWTMGPALGTQTLAATLESAEVVLSAEAAPGPAATLDVVGGDGQVGTVGQRLTDPLVVRATDRFGNASRSPVRFEVASGGGSVTVANVVPTPDGLATTVWTLGTAAGEAQVVASSEAAPPVHFHATTEAGPAAALQKVAGDQQTGPATRPLTQPLELRVEDAYGNGVPGFAFSFSVVEGGGSIDAPATSDQEGKILAVFTLGPSVGIHRVMASPNTSGTGHNLASVTFEATATSLPPAQVSVVAGDGQTARVGSAVTSAPAVLVSDAVGNPVPGVAVNFSASGGGSVAGDSPTTDATGVATAGSWTLGTTAGQQTLTAAVVGIPTATLRATALPGPVASLQVTQGDGQSGLVGSPVSTPPAVSVVDSHGNAISGISVSFAVTGGGGTVTGSPTTTDASGRATLGGWTLGPNPGSNSLQASAAGAPPVTVTATGSTPPPGFNLDVQFVGSVSAAQQAIVASAASRWESVVTGDLPEASTNLGAGACGVGHPSYNGTVDDVVVFVEFVTIDGPGGTLGSAGPCWIRGGSMLPIFGAVRMDAADAASLEASGRLYDVVLHELGHVLGVGTLWQATSLLQAGGSSDPYFSGAGAIAEYTASGGGHPNPVPVENSGGSGTRDAHWRESLFQAELMTGWINHGTSNPLSRVTAASLGDLGYTVNVNAADSFAAAAPSALQPLPPFEIREVPLGVRLVIR